ncbi:type II toxin-antitoxin system HicA family toxin [Maribacter sp. 2307ULW6-5]|uniref:type II toxin-antitoxin system HicA family toxin n=1 Tax=Maribacter sp. 2307ULW6-5 TaxID=3386275 RepID=UPI0039BC6B1C
MKILAHSNFKELSKKGKTGGSSVKCANENKDISNLPRPHPGKIAKPYVIKQILFKFR